MEISIFKNIKQSQNGEVTSVDEFINKIRFGEWKDVFERISKIEDKAQRTKAKKEGVPYVTISGKFNRRAAIDLVKHSGFICLDFDGLEDKIDEAFNKIISDHYTYAAFKSVSGRGISAIVKIDPKRHLDAFLGLEVYFADKYELYVDTNCKDVSRARFVSYDPNAYVNHKSEKFTKYIPKSEHVPSSKLPNIITGSNDMKFMIDQIVNNSIDITGSDYRVWLQIGFAISEEFGEMGRDYYHAVSQFSSKYDRARCDRQYTHCIKSGNTGISFPTFLYYVKKAGLAIISNETKEIIVAASQAKNGGRTVNDTINTLKVVSDIPEERSREIVQKVFLREDIDDANKTSKLNQLEVFLNHNYDLKRNELTRFVESEGEEIDTKFLNSIYIRARKEVDDKIKFDEVDRLIQSDFIQEYNPLVEFFERNNERNPTGLIKKLADSLESDTGKGTDYKERFLKKWLVGIISSAHGEHSSLLLALTGGQNTGKTEFFRRLLPDDLKNYYAESKLDAGKDDEILMTQKLIVLDDEFGGKSKLEAKRLKELTSKEWFDLREPYGRKNIKLKRLAVLAGTSNDKMLLNDPTGNRRIIPINIIKIDHELYNSIDKTDLFLEAYKLYMSDFDWRMNTDDIALLNGNTDSFEQIRPEKELIIQYFQPSNENVSNAEFMQAMTIKSHIEILTGQRMFVNKIGQELDELGYILEVRKIGGQKVKGYWVVKVDQDEIAKAKNTSSEKENEQGKQIQMNMKMPI